MSAYQQDRQGHLILLGNSLWGYLQTPKSKVVQSFPVTVDCYTHGCLASVAEMLTGGHILLEGLGFVLLGAVCSRQSLGNQLWCNAT